MWPRGILRRVTRVKRKEKKKTTTEKASVIILGSTQGIKVILSVKS